MDALEPWTQYTRFLVALIAVLDPFMAVPIFLSLCAGRTDVERRRFARLTCFTVAAVLVGAAMTGETVLRVLGTSLAAFRIAGGLVLLLMALAMLQARPGDVRQTAEEVSELGGRDASGVARFAIPLLAGPGAISTVMIAVQHGSLQHQAAIIAAIGAVCFLLWVMLRLAIPLMGPTGLNIANRLLGLLLAAIGVESMAIGLKELFPALAGA